MELAKIEKHLVLFDVQQSVFDEIKTYEKLEITDSKTEKDVRQARASVRNLRYKIQRRQKDLNAELNQRKKEIKDGAESLIERIVPTENDLDGKIKTVEDEKARIKAEKEAAEEAEKARLAAERAAEEARLKAIRDEEEARLQKIREQQEAEAARLEKERKRIQAQQEEERARINAEKAAIEAARIQKEKEEQQRLDAERKKIADERAALESEKARITAEEQAKIQALLDKEKAEREVESRRIRAEKAAEEKHIADEKAKVEAEKKRLADEERQIRLKPSKEFAINTVEAVLACITEEFNLCEADTSIEVEVCDVLAEFQESFTGAVKTLVHEFITKIKGM